MRGLSAWAISPDGQRLALVNGAGRVEWRDLASGRSLRTLPAAAGFRVDGLAFSPDGGLLAAAGDRGLALWRTAATGRAPAYFSLPAGGVPERLVFSPDGALLAAAGNGRIALWKTATGALLRELESPATVLAFGPDGRSLAAGSGEGGIKLWNLETGAAVLLDGAGGARPNGLDFGPDGRLLAALDADGRPQLYEATTLAPRVPALEQADAARSTALAFSPDGSGLAALGADNLLREWDLSAGRLRLSVASPDGSRLVGVVYAPDGGSLAAAGEGGQAFRWDLATGAALPALSAGAPLASLAYGAGGTRLGGQTRTGAVMVWNLPVGTGAYSAAAAAPAATEAGAMAAPAAEPVAAGTGGAAARAAAAPANATAPSAAAPAAAGGAAAAVKDAGKPQWPGVTALALSPDGRWMGEAADGGALRLVGTGGGVRFTLAAHHGQKVAALRFDADGKTLASAGRDGRIEVRAADSGALLRVLRGPEHAPRTLDVSRDGVVAASGEDVRILLWDAAGKLIRILGGHRDFVNAVAFSPDGTLLASGGADTAVRIWDWRAGTTTLSLPVGAEINSLSFSPDGRTLAAAAADGRATLWDVASGRLLKTLAGHQRALRSVAFNARGNRLATAGGDGRILLWDPSSGLQLRSLPAGRIVNTLAFDPAGRLYSGDEANAVGKWDAETGDDLGRETVPSPTSLHAPADPGNGLAASGAAGRFAAVLGRMLDWLVPAAEAAIPDPPGGPILIVTGSANKFSGYYAEILRNEGFNEFATADIGTLSANLLAGYDLVILGDLSLSPAQATLFADWVAAGGNLIAMHPDPQLAGLLGLAPTGSSLAEGYLQVDPAKVGGIVTQTLQFHGSADRYLASGATVVATLYSDWDSATANPAVTVRSVGTAGGQAAAFTYDLARSIVYTRQGNPAWAGQERDGLSPKRSDDQFYGAAANDPKPDWVDLQNRVAVPQADEQQRLLANLILNLTQDRKPLPRFWYFPFGKKAVLLMTGDDHASNGTAGRFDYLASQSPAGCSVANWECIRGTSYMFTDTPITNAQVAAYTAAGFEVGLHVDTNCADWTPSSLQNFYKTQLAEFARAYPSAPKPLTQRHHCIALSDWATAAKVQTANGIRLDTSYYFWPPKWGQDRPGLFTGSAMPMRWADLDGTLIDNYNVVTQLTDESGQTYPYTVDTLLDRALGAEGYYGVYTINAHNDLDIIPEAIASVASAKARGVPVISAAQLLAWLDGRNGAAFRNFTWSNGQLGFTVTAPAAAVGLRALLPRWSASGPLTTITGPAGSVPYSFETVKGVDYAVFAVASGSNAYTASYAADTTPPKVQSKSPAAGATGVSLGTGVSAVFDEALDPASVTAAGFTLRAGTGGALAATVGYDAASRSATLTPIAPLAPLTAHTASLGGVRDVAGNALASPLTWSFTTAAQPCATSACTLWPASTSPAVAAENDGGSVELGVKFTSELPGQVTGIRFYKGSGNTGTHIGSLWSAAGKLLAQATFSGETASGWQQVSFASPVNIAANTVYVASYHAPAGHYAVDGGYFATAVDRTPLHAPADGGGAGGNGVFAYGSSPAFPASTYQASNYWVDLLFRTGTVVDTTPPTVTAQSPLAGATGVVATAAVTAQFSEDLDAATVSSTSVLLRNAAGQTVTAAVAYAAATRTVTLTPAAPLAAGAAYTVRLVGGSAGIKDPAGNALAADVTWSFTVATGSAPDCSKAVSLWPATAVPATAAEPDPSAVQLGVKFRASGAGYVCGIRFYKGTGNSGTHVGTLWSAAGQSLATASFAGETATGWQQVLFAAPVAIAANTVYVASYLAPVGRYAVNRSFFTAAVVNGPLTAPTTAEAGGNGVYRYGSGGFPSSTYNANNYWVDVLYVPAAAP